jgi:NAD(P)-dependent dehydrogenase (short-subunit alcohol dehydrogenase family)
MVVEPGDPVMIVVGGGAIALSTAQELCALQGHRVVVLWRRDPDLARAVESIGAVFITAARPDSGEGLDRADVRHAVTILALSPDDHLNLHAALLARDLNPQIRIVLRQFNRTLSDKIEQNLPNCSVLSLAWHSAATYAAAAIDPSCFRGLQFGAGRPADRICHPDRRRLRDRRRFSGRGRAGAGSADHFDRQH